MKVLIPKAVSVACLLAFLCAPICAGSGQQSTTLEGQIIVGKGQKPELHSQGRVVLLSGGEESISDTLQDPRISGKQLKLIGEYRRDGSFEVTDLYTVHPDGLYRIIYYCRVCHITAFSPGNCVCCQRPTEPQEVPLSDPRVHHENVKPK